MPISRAKMVAWRCQTWRRMKPICSSRTYDGREGFTIRLAETVLVIYVPHPCCFRPRSQRQMRVANVRTRVKLAHGALEANPAALNDVGAVADELRKMQVLLGDDDADALFLHGQDRVHHLLHDL